MITLTRNELLEILEEFNNKDVMRLSTTEYTFLNGDKLKVIR